MKEEMFMVSQQVIEVDRKLIPGIEWSSVQEAQKQTGIPDLEQKIADGQYVVWPAERSYIMTVDTYKAFCAELEAEE